MRCLVIVGKGRCFSPALRLDAPFSRRKQHSSSSYNNPKFNGYGNVLISAGLKIPTSCANAIKIRSFSLSRAAGRNTLSRFWIPSIIARRPQSVENTSASDILERLGFYSKAYNGIYHFLPLGLRVQQKLERLLDHHMLQIGASSVSLSSLSEVELWKRSERYDATQSELFQLQDRKDVRFLLSPTHEEEITNIVKQLVESWRDLPLRLYQISRKYRDERRPRDGLLRAREFLMKDLYTFDASVSAAKQTYGEVELAYRHFFEDLKVPYLRTAASSGNMGGTMSHEYHVVSVKGEDEVVKCSNCDYCANAEVAERDQGSSHIKIPAPELPSLFASDALNELHDTDTIHHEPFLTVDQRTFVIALSPIRPGGTKINTHILRTLCPIDPSFEDPYRAFLGSLINSPREDHKLYRILYVYDRQLEPPHVKEGLTSIRTPAGHSLISKGVDVQTEKSMPDLDLMSISSGDKCGKCKHPNGVLKVQKTLELGHTFHLGERYSRPLHATIASAGTEIHDPARSPAVAGGESIQPSRSYVQMGCHGIGVSRLIAAVAETKKDSFGLNWPRLMAPFEVIILPATGFIEEAKEVYDILGGSDSSIDCVIDDRDVNYGSKIRDAELIGYPVILTVGRDWRKSPQCCQVQWRVPQRQKNNVEKTGLEGAVSKILQAF